MAMTRLQLVNQLAQECGVTGFPLTTAVGLAGEPLRLAGWIDAAWSEIQTEHDDWDWMRSSNILGSGVSFVPSAAQFNIPLGTGAGQVGVAVDSFGKWNLDTFRNYVTTVGVQSEAYLDPIPYDVWRDSYMFGAMRQVQTRPVSIAKGPDQSLNIGPPSNGLYTVTGDFWMAPSVMALDADVPLGLPTRYNFLIVYKAMMKYAGYESAPEVYDRGQSEYGKMFAQLELARLPEMGFAGALDA